MDAVASAPKSSKPPRAAASGRGKVIGRTAEALIVEHPDWSYATVAARGQSTGRRRARKREVGQVVREPNAAAGRGCSAQAEGGQSPARSRLLISFLTRCHFPCSKLRL